MFTCWSRHMVTITQQRKIRCHCKTASVPGLFRGLGSSVASSQWIAATWLRRPTGCGDGEAAEPSSSNPQSLIRWLESCSPEPFFLVVDYVRLRSCSQMLEFCRPLPAILAFNPNADMMFGAAEKCRMSANNLWQAHLPCLMKSVMFLFCTPLSQTSHLERKANQEFHPETWFG